MIPRQCIALPRVLLSASGDELFLNSSRVDNPRRNLMFRFALRRSCIRLLHHHLLVIHIDHRYLQVCGFTIVK